jgi:ubiquinone/menaquinone biosynthesis C-methylase UbiE
LPPSEGKGSDSAGENVFTGEAAAGYDAWFETPAGRHARELEDELLKKAAGERGPRLVLDIGCGTGMHLPLFTAEGSPGVGLEPSWDMLARAKEKRAARGLYFIQGRAEALPFRDGTFDLVTLITSLEFVADADRALAEAGRVCRGRIVVAALNAWSLSALFRRARRNVKRTLFRAVRFYNPYELRRALRRQLSPPVEIASTLHFHPLFARRLARTLAGADRLLTRLGWLLGAFLVAAGDVKRDST